MCIYVYVCVYSSHLSDLFFVAACYKCVYMFVYKYVCMYLYMWVCIYLHMEIRLYMCIYMLISTLCLTFVWWLLVTGIYMYVCMFWYVYVCIYMILYIYMPRFPNTYPAKRAPCFRALFQIRPATIWSRRTGTHSCNNSFAKETCQCMAPHYCNTSLHYTTATHAHSCDTLFRKNDTCCCMEPTHI